MSSQPLRSFSLEEHAFLEAVAVKLAPERCDSLRRDIQIARVKVAGDFLQVVLPGYQRPDYQGHRNLPFEGKMQDVEGGAMSVLVNVDQNDRLLEVEYIFWENYDVLPDWSSLEVVPEHPPETPAI